MSAKTKIIVLRTKEVISTGIILLLGILFLCLLIKILLPGKSTEPTPENVSTSGTDIRYIPGIYTTQLILGNQTVDVEVIIDQNAISSIRMVNLSDSITTMYPLLEPAFHSICDQVYSQQSLEGITYSPEQKYTSMVLLEAIQNSLNKALAD